MLKPFKILEERELKNAGNSRCFEVDLETPEGKFVTWGYVQFSDIVIVLPIDNEGNVFLKQEWRLSRNDFVWEVVSGKIEVNEPTKEDILATAHRETQEEVGMKAEKMTFLKTFHPHNHMRCKAHLFVAENLSQNHLSPDEHEIIEVKKLPFSDAYDLVMNQQEPNGQTALIFMLAKDYLESKK